MKMKPIDAYGCLYSSGGLRFGGFQTSDFIESTQILEFMRPGIREEIIGEAHYLACWLHRFPEIGFILSLLFFKSIFLSAITFMLFYLLEYLRFYIVGPSYFFSFLCKIWNWVKFPIFLIAIIHFWPTNKIIAIATFVFAIIQGAVGLISAVFMAPLKIAINAYIFKKTRDPNLINMEGMAVEMIINKWEHKLSN